jgi:repressor LexA
MGWEDEAESLNGEPNPLDEQTIFDKFDNIKPLTLKKFPMLGEIACGEPIYADEDKETYVMADSDIKADFCLKAKGESMINARIYDGDLVFIKKMPMVENGDIAAVIIEDEATLKRVYYYPDQNKLILNPENSAFDPLVYIGEELNHIHILGKAVFFMSAL